MASDLIRVSGLWIKESKNGGVKFMTGKTDTEIPAGRKLLVFKNTRKQKDSDPDYILNVAPADDSELRRATSQRPERQADDPGIPF